MSTCKTEERGQEECESWRLGRDAVDRAIVDMVLSCSLDVTGLLLTWYSLFTGCDRAIVDMVLSAVLPMQDLFKRVSLDIPSWMGKRFTRFHH